VTQKHLGIHKILSIILVSRVYVSLPAATAEIGEYQLLKNVVKNQIFKAASYCPAA
jgi:hypothetical protein